MIEQQFKSVCRLNRLLIVMIMGLLTVEALLSQSPWAKGLFLGLLGFNLVCLLGNEFLLKLTKRLREAELQTILHFSLFLPSALALYWGIQYGLTGHLTIAVLGVFPMLQAQFLERVKLSRILGALYAVVITAGLWVGYPKSFSLQPTYWVISLLALAGSLYYFGTLLTRLVRTHASQMGKLQSMAATDVLTGLTNRRQFNSRLHEEVARARRHETPLALALFDLDDFKRLNDFYGHPVGDSILKELGHLIRQNIRESDLPARYGGEEFAIILPETREIEAYDLLERIRLLISQSVFCLPDNPLTLTISVGVVQLEPRQHTTFEFVELADKALYEAKRQGKNQVVKASTLMPKVLLKKNPGAFPF